MFKRLFVLLFMLAVVAPHPTAASTPLTIIGAACYGTGGNMYYPGFYCYAHTSGGSGGNTYNWVGGSQVWVAWNYGDTAGGTCYVGPNRTITLTVMDSSGATASHTQIFHCTNAIDG